MNKKKIFLLFSIGILLLGLILSIISQFLYDMWYIAGFFVGIGFVLSIVAIINLLIKRNEVCYYDERQIMARGKAFKISFLTLVITLLIEGLIRDIIGFEWSNFFVTVATHLIFSLGVFVDYSIFKDAYVQINNNKKNLTIILLICGCLNLIFPIKALILNEFVVNGMLQIEVLNLLCFLLCLSITISFIIKNKLDKKNDKEEAYYEES